VTVRQVIEPDELEGVFVELLKEIGHTPALFKVARAMFEDLWNHRLQSRQAQAAELEKEVVSTDRKISQMLDRVVETVTA
jgi:site-specific DNA recombinase